MLVQQIARKEVNDLATCHLKAIRMKNLMSQTELAEKSGISRQTINEIENGHRENISTFTLVKLSEALGCKIADIFF